MKRLVPALLVVAGLSLQAGAALACVSAPPSPPPITVTVTGPTSATITARGYATFGSAIGQFCACALDVAPGTITAVNSLTVADDSTGAPLAQFVFSPNSNVGSGFNGVSGGSWSGFLSGVSAVIPPSVPVRLVFDVTLALALGGSNDALVADDVATRIGKAVHQIGTDEADAAGNLLGTHQAIRTVNFIVSAVTTVGIVALLIGLTGAAWVTLRRRRPLV